MLTRKAQNRHEWVLRENDLKHNWYHVCHDVDPASNFPWWKTYLKTPFFFFFFTEIQLNLLHCAKHTYFAEKNSVLTNNVLMNKWTQTVTLTLLWSCLCLCVLFLRQLFSLFYSPSYILTFLCLNVLFSFIWQFLHLLFTFYTGLFLCVYSVLYALISYDT